MKFYGELTIPVRTGRILYALGNLRALQGRLDESYECHRRVREQFCSTIGETNHRTADISHKLAEHLIRMDRLDESRYDPNNLVHPTPVFRLCWSPT